MIELDDKTAAALQAQASQCNLSLPAFLERMALAGAPSRRLPELSEEELNRAIDEASDDLPAPPLTYTREDIYFDHD